MKKNDDGLMAFLLHCAFMLYLVLSAGVFGWIVADFLCGLWE